MVKSVKRERTGSEEPMLPLTPESSNDRGDGKRSGSAGNDDKDASPFSPSPRKRVKQNKAAASRSKVMFFASKMCLKRNLTNYRPLLPKGYYIIIKIEMT